MYMAKYSVEELGAIRKDKGRRIVIAAKRRKRRKRQKTEEIFFATESTESTEKRYIGHG